MILTKTWLHNFLEFKNDTLETTAQALNAIGLEVEKTCSLKTPDKVVVGFVKEKTKHENSEKLSICQVDVGKETLQIVCGAKNVQAGQFVAVALEGACLPNGIQIKKAKLRGVESCGMLCSSIELGFAKINEGIMVLDESIGQLETGRSLNSYELFDDWLIEIELTPNRGDCLSIYGIARDLAAFWNLDLKESNTAKENENVLGIGRVLRVAVQDKLNSFFHYKVVEFKNSIQLNLLIMLRLAQIDMLGENAIDNLLNYATHSTGVLFNAYNCSRLNKDDNEIIFNIQKAKKGESTVSCKNQLLSVSGIYQEPIGKCDEKSKIVIIEAHYTDPSVIAKAKKSYKIQDEKILYRSFRGSEPRLHLGIDFLLSQLQLISNADIYSSSQQISNNKKFPIIALNIEDINVMIGQDVDKDEILRILKKIGFELIFSNKKLINVKAPLHRPDIKNLADICEEIVRMVGIDNITSKPLEFVEKNRFNQNYKQYKKLLKLREKAANNGYFESLHYILDNQKELEDFGFEQAKLKLINPITEELNTLRTTLLNHLLNAASLNVKNSKKMIKLFESGIVFTSDNKERERMALIHCGYKEEAKISNKAKPDFVNFYDFLLDVKNIVGDFELQNSDYVFLSPYEQAKLIINGVHIGFIGRLHLQLERKKNLTKTYVCEFDCELIQQERKQVRLYSKFPSISRDLSILISKDYEYEKIKNCIQNLQLDLLESFRVVDIYNDETLKDSYSLTLHFVFRAQDKTLEDSEVVLCMDKILQSFQTLGLQLR
ncbi:phenylalanine--tRNA ligase subunit beta [Campylobacter sp. MIT 21-1685]|uniref:phenylalanine--tRNA ligase subunit beta n=1 Tax=unclassified Campylobacter TaxID=2593542 RepID=UPI00224B114B|nr:MULTISPECIES: phenylalanine--tRNA ligase subunit beta [unclassified Campylobacter]MCX2682981.1 phenylalanine--tRNA ligase subunit beta [Campylobacter sp. MIT 21-1684]MCX2751263.1 phenylalanine--tRNA ligase subunit beta [Campylobacter sp. MIT 21-1682]MCX2807462.1 phenylalanine--tRNA ligase subunit beta [Campylobacter sp. MIT 21-1685]